MKFCNLYLQTEYSMLNSSIKLDELVSKLHEYEYDSACITDINVMHGALKFYSLLKKNNIKPIIGLSLDLDSKFGNSRILLYCKNEKGYRNLLRLSTLRLTKNSLCLKDIYELLNNLVIILPYFENDLVRLIFNDDINVCLDLLRDYEVLNKLENNSLFIGVSLKTSDEVRYSCDVMNFCERFKLNSVAISKTMYLEKDDSEVYMVLKSIENGAKGYELNSFEENCYLINQIEAIDLFRKYPILISNTIRISNMCNLSLDYNGYKMPEYIIPSGKNINDKNKYLKDLSYLGLKKRLEMNNINKNMYQVYINRLDYELSVISKMGFCDYFLIVYDFISFAKKNNILVGPGRGSAPGSLVSFSLGITEIDPIKYNLLFERFLNEMRVTLPDIDTDFPDDRRDEVIRYLKDRYGINRVCHISTFGTFQPKLAIRDISRVINLKSLYLDEILKHIDGSKSISEVLESDNYISKLISSNDLISFVFKIAKKIENLPRNLSIHAAGIIIGDKDLLDYTGFSMAPDGLYQSQYEASDMESIGLVKIDFLGLRNLTMIDRILYKIGIKDSNKFKVYNLPLNDKKTYDLLNQGFTNGIFQLESVGMTDTIMKMKVNSLTDICDCIALYRPGPMDMIPSFIKAKNSKNISYVHNDLVPILKDTNGVIVYQEQILMIANRFSGFSLGEAVILRRAVSKKNEKMLLSMKDKFISGAIKKGYSKDIASKVYDLILKFASYGFNKSHSISYSYVAYIMAYLKANYFKEFISVLLSYNIGNSKQIKAYIKECKKHGIEVCCPSINISTNEFVIKDNKIYISLLQVGYIGINGIEAILNERNTNGLFKDYDDFIIRTKGFLNKKQVEYLIYSGSLDEFNLTRKSMINEYDKSIELSKFASIFKDEINDRVFDSSEYSLDEVMKLEYMSLGFNLKFNIFDSFKPFMEKNNIVCLSNISDKKSLSIGILTNVKVIKTKKATEMAFINLKDDDDEIEATIFNEVYEKCKDLLNIGEVLIVQIRKDNNRFIINDIYNKNRY